MNEQGDNWSPCLQPLFNAKEIGQMTIINSTAVCIIVDEPKLKVLRAFDKIIEFCGIKCFFSKPIKSSRPVIL